MPNSPNEDRRRQIVGVLPAGGQALRSARMPCSKEVFPVGFRQTESGPAPKAACQYVLEQMRTAGISRVYVVLRQGKWDIPAYLGDGAALEMSLAYLLMRLPYGVPFTLDQAYPFVKDDMVALGFPDVVSQRDDVFVRLAERQSATAADLVLGLFPSAQLGKKDLVDYDEDGRVRSVIVEKLPSRLRYTWIFALWSPVFTRFMHEYLCGFVEAIKQESAAAPFRELSLGEVIQAAIHNNLRVEGVPFPDETYIDIGTPNDLVRAVRSTSGA